MWNSRIENEGDANNPGYVSFDSVAQDYDISRGIPGEAQIQISARMRDAANWNPGDIFLDAGAGTGRFSVPLARLGTRVVGLEISANMLARMRANQEAASREEKTDLPLRAVRADLRRMPVASGVCQAALIVHILHLIADWRAVLEEVRRVLKPGGVLLLARQGGEGSPTRTHYNAMVKDRGLLAPILGAYEDEVCDHLAGQGARIETVDMSDVAWTDRRPVSLTLELLRRRTWSSLWNISDTENAVMLAETEIWALQRYGSLDALEESRGACRLSAIHWS